MNSLKVLLFSVFFLGLGYLGWVNYPRVVDFYTHLRQGSGSNTATATTPATNSNSPSPTSNPTAAPVQSVVLKDPYYFARERISFVADEALRIIPAGTQVRKIGGGGQKFLVVVGSYRGIVEADKLTQDSSEVVQDRSMMANANMSETRTRQTLERQSTVLDRQLTQVQSELRTEEDRQDRWKRAHPNEESSRGDRTLFLKNEINRIEADKNRIQLQLSSLPQITSAEPQSSL